MFQGFEIAELPLSIKSGRQKVESFLTENDLDYCCLDYYAGIFKNGEMLAGGGLEGDTIKCVAVSLKAREHNLSNRLISHLRGIAIERGSENLFVYTKPKNEEIFTSLAFHLIGRSKDAILLESDPHGISDFCENLSKEKTEGKNGCIVMNCNPMTMGHRYLIRKASQMVDTLHVFVVSENKSEFSYSDRLQMVKDGVADIKNVKVHEGGKYIISSASFPCYFIKCSDSISRTQIELDLDIFCTHIAPVLDISVRFVGTEPYDRLTEKYNRAMKSQLNNCDINVIEIERMKVGDKPISASFVRQLLKDWKLEEACSVVPATSRPYILKKCSELIATLATDALREELGTTPKPGLVDRNDNGAHFDMDFSLMNKSIDALHPHFIRLAKIGLRYYDSPQKEVSAYIRNIGIEAEKEMLKITGGINTHRGAIFSMGLCITAIAMIIASQKNLVPGTISQTIAFIVDDFQKQQNSKGGYVCAKYNIKGALDNAKEGYAEILSKTYVFYRELIQAGENHNTANIKTLLFLMAFVDDTNIYYRRGVEAAQMVKEKANSVLQHYDEIKVNDLNKLFVHENISPGGCADMLALILFVDKILTN